VPRRNWRSAPTRAYVPRSPLATSRMMATVRNKNSRAELVLRRALWRDGFRYRLHDKRVLGRPDLLFLGLATALFVDSDFWHARPLVEGDEEALRATMRGARKEWWIDKLKRNANRDTDVTDLLEADGWLVIRVWESDILRNPSTAMAGVVKKLRARATRYASN
jgi:DNA mismatch endonuclease (patch repair protein)